MGNVQHSVILDVCSVTNANAMHISSYGALRPDADIVT
jgi:hypothetical protein